MMKELAKKKLEGLSLDELWTLHDQVAETLLVRIAKQKHKLENWLRRLERPEEKRTRRPYPKVLPKFQNPNEPSQTWTGRGKQPRWLTAQLRSGKLMHDLLIH